MVINTCCHFDHIGNNKSFPNARFIVQKLELPLAIHPPPWALYYYPELAFNLLDVRDRLELIDGDIQVADAVSVYHLGGHSPGAQVVLVETDAGRVCIPGDLVPFYKNIELNWPMGAFFDVEAVVRPTPGCAPTPTSSPLTTTGILRPPSRRDRGGATRLLRIARVRPGHRLDGRTPASCSGRCGRHRRLHCAGCLIVVAIVAVGGVTFSS